MRKGGIVNKEILIDVAMGIFVAGAGYVLLVMLMAF
jgi:hypothetical protein|tara:strand:+ start:129 stop:236 length:108 start_codon:yes stop_codon:yes gene_type:complete